MDSGEKDNEWKFNTLRRIHKKANKMIKISVRTKLMEKRKRMKRGKEFTQKDSVIYRADKSASRPSRVSGKGKYGHNKQEQARKAWRLGKPK